MSSLPPIFPLKIHVLPLRRPRFCLKTFVLPSWGGAIPEVEAFIKKAPVTECSWSPQPNTSLVDTPNCQHSPSTLRGCCHLLGRKLKQVLVIHNSAPLSFVGWPSSSDHPLSQNLPACIFPDRRTLLIPPHIPTHAMSGTHTETVSCHTFVARSFSVRINLSIVKCRVCLRSPKST